VVANAAAALDINVSSTFLTSEGVTTKEVDAMRATQHTRVTVVCLGIRLRFKIVLAAAALLIAGYGDGLSPST